MSERVESRTRPGIATVDLHEGLPREASLAIATPTASPSLPARLVQQSPAPTGPLIASRYRVVRELGHGSNAITCEAEDTKTGWPVVLKKLQLHGLREWKGFELFEREARVLESLDYPAIPRYLDYQQIDTADGPAFLLVQELAPGRSLAEWMRAGWRPGEADVVDVAKQVLKVLVYLHGREPPVIHRDLKPQNLVRDDLGHVAVVDFGAVQAAWRATMMGGSTIAGTFGYMPPEQLMGVATAASDLYSLGATLLHLLTGQTPDRLPHAGLRFDLRALTAAPSFAGWLARMVEHEPGERFQSAAEALDALRAGRGGRPPKSTRNRSRLPRRLAAVSSGVALGAGVLGLVWLGTRDSARPAGDGFGEASVSTGIVGHDELDFDTQDAVVQALATSPGSDVFASGGADRTVKLWPTIWDTEPQKFSPEGQFARLMDGRSLAISPDGKILAGSNGNAVTTWDVATGAAQLQLTPPTRSRLAPVTSIAFSPDGTTLASGSLDGSVRLWQLPGGALATTFAGGGRALAFSPDGTWLAGIGGPNLWVLRMGPKEKPVQLADTTHEEALSGVAFADDNRAVTLSASGVVTVWSVSAGDPVLRFRSDPAEGDETALAVDGDLAATGGQDGIVHFWDLASGQTIGTFQADPIADATAEVTSLALIHALGDTHVLIIGLDNGHLVLTRTPR
jgi:WD40 repeat protein